MKYWTILLIVFLTISCNSQAQKMTESEFSKFYLSSLKKAYPNVDFKIQNNLTISSDYQGKKFIHYLDNVFKEYIMQPDSIDEITTRYINSTLELYQPKKDIILNHIVPIIKPIDYLDEIKHLSQENGNEKEPWIVYEKYNDQLIIIYGEDTEKSIRYFNEDEFNKTHIERDTLLEFAKKNLASILPDIQRMGTTGSYGIACGGDFEVSLILLGNMWTQGNFPVDGDFVIAIPNKDLLFITGSNNKTEIEKIRKIALDSYKTGNYPISPYLFKWTGNRFEKYE